MRKSNIELLRIVAMFMIVLHHLVIKGADTCGYMRPYESSDGLLGGGINSLVVSGVDVFLLISGYFGCRNIIYNTIRLVLDMAIYGAICFGVSLLIGGTFSLKMGIGSMWIFSNWFVVHFIALLMLSPIIEKALIGTSEKELGYWIVLLAIINVIMGYFYPNINASGYHVMNFLLLYLIGRYLRIFNTTRIVKMLQRYTIPILAFSWAMTFLMFLVVYVWLGNDMPATKLWGYHNPFVILTAISLFIIFTKFDVQSNLINSIAKLTFPVFLLHTGVAIQPTRNAFFHSIYIDYGYWGIFLSAILLFIACALIAYPIEKLKGKPYGMIRQIIDNRKK